MKNIAVLVFDVSIEYNYTVIEGISKYFNEKKDVRLIITPVKSPEKASDIYSAEFDYQYWTSIELIKSKDIDGIIVVTNSFNHYVSIEMLGKYLSVFEDKPIVSVGRPLNIKNCKYTMVSCHLAYEQIVEHIYKKHNRTKIGFFSASLTQSPESVERLEAYKDALRKFNLDYCDDWILAGDFTPGTARDVILDRYKCKEDVPFDALLCANDHTAFGANEAFSKLGIKVPDDVILVGFDDTEVALSTIPTLTTINQHIEKTGYMAAKTIYDQLENVPVDDKIVIDAKPIYRQSCGCISSSDQSSNYFDGEKIMSDTRKDALVKQIQQSSSDLIIVYNLLHHMDTSNDMKQFFDNLRGNLRYANISAVAICIYNEVKEHLYGDRFLLPDSAKLDLVIDSTKDIFRNLYSLGGLDFNPHTQLLPSDYSKINAGNYILVPIFQHTKNYGYMILRLPNYSFLRYSIIIKILITSLAQSYDYTKEKINNEKLIERNQNLKMQSKTDELTKALNRRGFMEYGQQLIDASNIMDKPGCIFFCDLDGLKKINDTYGHNIGDLAIQTEAKVLKAAFRTSDMVGRLSGDEFGVVAPGFKIRKADVLRERLRNLNEQYSKEAGLPFILSISVGPFEFNQNDDNLQSLLQRADQKLYDEKHLKHEIK